MQPIQLPTNTQQDRVVAHGHRKVVYYDGNKYEGIGKFCAAFKQNDTMYHAKNELGWSITQIGDFMKKRMEAGQYAPKFREKSKPKSVAPKVPTRPEPKTKKLVLTAAELMGLAKTLELQEEVLGVPQTLTLKVVVDG